MKDDVIKYEKIMNESREVFEELEKALKKVEDNQDKYKELTDYYASEEFMEDVDKFYNSEEYKNVANELLTEDGVFELIERTYDASIKMLEISTRILKGY